MNKKKEINEEPKVPSVEASVSTEEKKSDLASLMGFDMKDFIAKPSEEGIIFKRELTTIPVKIPNNQVWFRIHPTMEVPVYLLLWKEENERYLVHKNAIQYLQDQTKLNILYLGVYQNGNPFLFPVPQRDEKGKWQSWHESAFSIVKLAREKWIRAVPERSINGYTAVVSVTKLPDPIWPEKSMAELIAIAFRERIIFDDNHTIVKQLQGQKSK
jgi:hypothetical protein